MYFPDVIEFTSLQVQKWLIHFWQHFTFLLMLRNSITNRGAIKWRQEAEVYALVALVYLTFGLRKYNLNTSYFPAPRFTYCPTFLQHKNHDTNEKTYFHGYSSLRYCTQLTTFSKTNPRHAPYILAVFAYLRKASFLILTSLERQINSFRLHVFPSIIINHMHSQWLTHVSLPAIQNPASIC
jgi:hypothetical protein